MVADRLSFCCRRLVAERIRRTADEDKKFSVSAVGCWTTESSFPARSFLVEWMPKQTFRFWSSQLSSWPPHGELLLSIKHREALCEACKIFQPWAQHLGETLALVVKSSRSGSEYPLLTPAEAGAEMKQQPQPVINNMLTTGMEMLELTSLVKLLTALSRAERPPLGPDGGWRFVQFSPIRHFMIFSKNEQQQLEKKRRRVQEPGGPL